MLSCVGMDTLSEFRRLPLDAMATDLPRLLARDVCIFRLVRFNRSLTTDGPSWGKLKLRSIGEAVNELSAVCECTRGVLCVLLCGCIAGDVNGLRLYGWFREKS